MVTKIVTNALHPISENVEGLVNIGDTVLRIWAAGSLMETADIVLQDNNGERFGELNARALNVTWGFLPVVGEYLQASAIEAHMPRLLACSARHGQASESYDLKAPLMVRLVLTYSECPEQSRGESVPINDRWKMRGFWGPLLDAAAAQTPLRFMVDHYRSLHMVISGVDLDSGVLSLTYSPLWQTIADLATLMVRTGLLTGAAEANSKYHDHPQLKELVKFHDEACNKASRWLNLLGIRHSDELERIVDGSPLNGKAIGAGMSCTDMNNGIAKAMTQSHVAQCNIAAEMDAANCLTELIAAECNIQRMLSEIMEPGSEF